MPLLVQMTGHANGSIRGQKFLSREAILFDLLLPQNAKCDTLYIVNKSFVSRFGAERPRKDAGACSRSSSSRVCLGIFFALALGDTGKMLLPRGRGILPMLDSEEVSYRKVRVP